MYSFKNDYSEGAHPKVLEAINKTNLEQTDGYGLDEYCKKATQVLKKQLNNDNVDVHYLVGGTQVNLTLISAVLKPYQAVMSVDSGHIAVHETGAIENTGHKIITRNNFNGKITIEMIDSMMEEHSDEHMVQPKMVYISQTTEFGSVYTTKELKKLYEYCHNNGLYLFVDGARLGSALVIDGCPTLADLAKYSDAFYIGGTKMGALFGECLVLINDKFKEDFRYNIKQKGALMAKGRLLGVQFLELFSNNLYFEIGLHENKMAALLKDGIKKMGYDFYVESYSNQQFPILPNAVIDQLAKQFSFIKMMKIDEHNSCIRLVTSFATKEIQVEQFLEILKKISL